MNTKENLLSKFNNKALTVLNTNFDNHKSEIKIFYDFIKSKPMLNAALIELESIEVDIEEFRSNRYKFPDNYLEKDRYRHRTEWFHKKRLFEAYNSDTTNGENILTTDLREYLHDQGIDYPFSETISSSGKPDIIGLVDTSEPSVLEIKLFKQDKKYDKGYIRKGLKQAYQYALDYGKSIGYLLIFNLDEKEIEFENEKKEPIKSIQIGNKVIYIIVVNVFCNTKSASEMRKPLPYLIQDSYLKNIEEDSDEV